MKFRYFNKSDKIDNNGLVVVIDVIRAFTTAAYAFQGGAKKIILVKDIESAVSLKDNNSEYLLMGEKDGFKIDGFDFSNSPYEIAQENLIDRTIVQRTSNGTAGVCNNSHCEDILVASFVNADAVVNYIKESKHENINFVITNDFRSADDIACASYICERLLSPEIPLDNYMAIVKQSRHANGGEHIHKNDMEYILQANKFDFNMNVKIEEGNAVLYKK